MSQLSQSRVLRGACQVILVGGLLTTAACPGQQQDEPKKTSASASGGESKNPDRNLAVATIGETTITVGQVEEELNKQNPYLRMRFSSPERRKEFVRNLVRFELLAREAQAQGLQRDPEVVRRVKRAMIDRLMEQLHAELVKMESISDKEVEAFFKQNLSLYQQPAKVRASWILLPSQAEANKVLAQARTKPNDVGFFGDLARQHSTDAATKEKRGDLDFFARDASNVAPEVIEAAFAEKKLWQVSGPIKTERGFAVVMKTGDLEAVSRPFEQEKTRIKNRLFNEKRLKAMESYVENLQAKAKVQIDEKALQKVKVDLTAKPAGGFPGHGGGHPH